jgi:hypothetical protein
LNVPSRWLIWSAGRGRQIRMKVGHVGCLDNCSKGEPFGSFSCWSGGLLQRPHRTPLTLPATVLGKTPASPAAAVARSGTAATALTARVVPGGVQAMRIMRVRPAETKALPEHDSRSLAVLLAFRSSWGTRLARIFRASRKTIRPFGVRQTSIGRPIYYKGNEHYGPVIP